MFYTLTSTNPKYDVMELKALNDWVVVNQLKSVPNVVDVNPFGGPTREYQVQLDPGKLVAYGLVSAAGRAGAGRQQHQRRRRIHRARRSRRSTSAPSD